MVKWEQTAMTFTSGTEQVYQTFCDLNPMLRERVEDEWNLEAGLSTSVFAAHRL